MTSWRPPANNNDALMGGKWLDGMGIWTGLLMREAIASTAIEHPPTCRCDICLAASGDSDAFARVWAEVTVALEEKQR